MLDIDVDDRGAVRRIDQMRDRVNRPDHILDVVADELHDYEREVFATSGLGTWAALSPHTVELKGSTRILVHTGHLLDELTSNAEISGDEVTISADADYVRFHKYGTSRMPARDPSPEPPAHVVDHLAQTVLDLIVDGHQ